MRVRPSWFTFSLLLAVLAACGGTPEKCAQVCDLWPTASELQQQCVGFVLDQRGYEVYGNPTCDEVGSEGQCLRCWSELGVEEDDCAAVYDACLSGDGIKVDLGGLRIEATSDGESSSLNFEGSSIESGDNEVSVGDDGMSFRSGDKKVSIGLGGIKVDGGDAKAEVSTGGVSVQSSREVRCAPGERCVCETGESCDFRCPSRGCELTCGADTECNVSCSGGGCNILCGSGATCDVSCSGGGCDLTCGTGSECSLSCSGGRCSCSGPGCP